MIDETLFELYLNDEINLKQLCNDYEVKSEDFLKALAFY